MAQASAAWPRRRRADDGEGFDPDARLADAARLEDRRPEPAVGGRRPHGRPAARRRRRDRRQNDDAGNGLEGRDGQPPDRHHPQPLEPGTDAGRLLRRCRGRGRPGHGHAQPRHRRGRVHPNSRRFQRHLRAQGDLRAGRCLAAQPLRQPRQCRADDPDGRGRRADARHRLAARLARHLLPAGAGEELSRRPRRRRGGPEDRLQSEPERPPGRTGHRSSGRGRGDRLPGTGRHRRGGGAGSGGCRRHLHAALVRHRGPARRRTAGRQEGSDRPGFRGDREGGCRLHHGRISNSRPGATGADLPHQPVLPDLRPVADPDPAPGRLPGRPEHAEDGGGAVLGQLDALFIPLQPVPPPGGDRALWPRRRSARRPADRGTPL